MVSQVNFADVWIGGEEVRSAGTPHEDVEHSFERFGGEVCRRIGRALGAGAWERYVGDGPAPDVNCGPSAD